MTAPSTGAPSLAGTLLSTARQVGRYFSLTSALPASALVLWTYTLIASGAAAGRPRLSNLSGKFTPTLAEIGVFVLIVIVISLFMHPLQFGMTQLLEGYWGTWRVPLVLSAIRANAYRKRARHLSELALQHERDSFAKLGIDVPRKREISDEEWELWEQRLQMVLGDRAMRYVLGRDEALRKSGQFPQDHRIMPTRLGNALRRNEDLDGEPYKIDAIATAPHFSLIAKTRASAVPRGRAPANGHDAADVRCRHHRHH
jgi:hypothetical protein